MCAPNSCATASSTTCARHARWGCRTGRVGACWPGAGCKPIKHYKRLTVKEHGRISGAEAMKAEIATRGPISCGISATEGLDAFAGGAVYREYAPNPQINHIVSVVGYGEELDADGTTLPYWVVRNSWGRAWADDGFFRIVRSDWRGGAGVDYNLGLELGCAWAVPGEWTDARKLGFGSWEDLTPAEPVAPSAQARLSVT